MLRNASSLPERSCFGNYRRMWHRPFDLMAESVLNKTWCRLCSLISFVLLNSFLECFMSVSFCVSYRVMQCCKNEASNISFNAENWSCSIITREQLYRRQACSYRCSIKLLRRIKHLESSDQSLKSLALGCTWFFLTSVCHFSLPLSDRKYSPRYT